MTRDRRVLTLNRAIQRFVAHQSAEGKTERTLAHYEAILGYMADQLPNDIDPLEITEDDLLDVLGSWRHLASTTRANRRSVLGSFFAWLARKYDCTDPTLNLGRPKKQPAARRRLAADDVAKLLTAAVQSSPRDVVLVGLLVMTGVRRAELIGLRWRDLEVDQRLLRVAGKGGKHREVPIPVTLARLLADVRAAASEHGMVEPQHYICPRRYEYQAGKSGKRRERVEPTKPIGAGTPEKILHRLARVAGLRDPDHVSPHDLRRAYAATFLAANPGDIYRLQAILGHADISTTRVYLGDVATLEARAAVDRVGFTLGPGDTPRIRADKPVDAESDESPATGADRADEGTRTLVPPPQAAAKKGDGPQVDAPLPDDDPSEGSV